MPLDPLRRTERGPHQEQADAIANAIERACRRMISDEKLVNDFWEAGYRRLTGHVEQNASRWVGRRILTMLVIGIVSAGVVWLVKTGTLK